MANVFTIEEIREIIHNQLADFIRIACQDKNQDKHRQVLIRYGTDILLRLMADFEKKA